VKVEIKKVEELVHELSVEVEPDLISEKLEARFAEVRKDVRLDGFRKGKAPMGRIKSQFGDEVKADVADQVIKTTFPDVLRDKELKVASTPAITELSYTDEGGFNYKARVEVYPEIDSIDTDGLIVTAVELEVTDEEVDNAVNDLRRSLAEHRKVERPAKNRDLVTADMKKISDPGMVLKEDGFPESTIDLSSPLTIKEFKEQIPGMTAGDEKEIEVNYDKDYPDKKFAGAQIKYLVKVITVQEQLLPEFDDALAKSTGFAETALELRMKIRDDINNQKKREIQQHQKGEIIRQMCEKNHIPIPPGLINEYLKAMVDDVKKRDPDANEADIRNNYHGVAVNTLRWSLLFNHIALKENIEVLPSDTEKVIKSFAEHYQMTEEQAKEMLHKTGKTESIRDNLLEEKVIDLLIDKAKIVSIEPNKENKDS